MKSWYGRSLVINTGKINSGANRLCYSRERLYLNIGYKKQNIYMSFMYLVLYI